MEPEPGNPLEAEGILNRPPYAVLMVSFTFSRGWLHRAITHASASPE